MRPATAEDYYVRLKRSLDLVLRRLGQPCTVEEVAAEAVFSRFHCQRMFRAMTGESIAELVRRLRLQRAAHRLRHESVNVIEVALDAGYGSEEAFSRAFRRGCGMSPNRYRTAWPPPAFSSQARESGTTRERIEWKSIPQQEVSTWKFVSRPLTILRWPASVM